MKRVKSPIREVLFIKLLLQLVNNGEYGLEWVIPIKLNLQANVLFLPWEVNLKVDIQKGFQWNINFYGFNSFLVLTTR